MEIRDLGSVLVEEDGLPVAIGNGRIAAVLSPLANRVGEFVTPASLIEAVWGTEAPPRAGQLLESLIWRLRKQLEPGRAARAESVLRRSPQGYQLDLGVAAVDSGRLRTALPQVRGFIADGGHQRALDRTAAVLALWRGEPYAEVADTGWLAPARQELVDVRLNLAELRVQALLTVGRPEEAIGELDLLLAGHPYRERLWAQRMLALYQAGRQADALAAFASARDLLAEELGVDPGPELRTLHERILDHDPVLQQQPIVRVRSAGVVQLPRRRKTLIGRNDDVARVSTLVTCNPLVTLVGPGGVGKTRLAVEVGFAIEDVFDGGVWFVDLSSIGTADPGMVDVTLVGTLGLADQPARRPIDVVTTYLCERRALLVMDNCEHVLGAAGAAVEEILDHCPGVRVLATSREPLDTPDELTHPVRPLLVAGTGAAADSAAALFLERARLTAGTTDTDDQLIRRICGAVGGLPLGIELAAAQVGTFDLVEIAEALERNPASLGRHGAGTRRHASLRDTVDWGFRLARRDEQVLHGRLAVIPGPFTLDVAAALCGVAPLRSDQQMDLVGGLVHRSLLTVATPAAPGRRSIFFQLPPVRAHAADSIDHADRGAVEAVRDRWVARRIANGPKAGRPGQAEFFHWLDDNAAALQVTLESTMRRRPDRAAIGIVGALVEYWMGRGRLAQATYWVDQLGRLPDRTELDPLDRALIDAVTGAVRAFQHRGAEATGLMLGCLTTLAAPDGQRRDEVATALTLGAAAAWTGDIWDVAARYVDAALEFSRNGLPHVQIVARAIRCANWTFNGDRAAGSREAHAVLEDNRKLANDLAALFARVTLTLTALFNDDPESALASSDELLLIQRRMGTVAVGDTIETRAAIRAAAGDVDGAVRCLGASAALSRRIGRDWPWHDLTAAVMSSLRDQVDEAEFALHWSSGERLGLGDPERFTPAWI